MLSTARTSPAASGVVISAACSAANQTGAALGALAFPALGPVGVVAIRQLVAAAVLGPTVRPRWRSMSAAQWWPVLGLALTFGVMNLGLYTAASRIGLGLAVTVEFLGPLALAIASSRRAVDLAAAVVAVAGVVVLTDPGPSTDVLGIGAALLAAVAWACYILLNRTVGRRMPGVEGTAAAVVLSALAWLPVAAVWFVLIPPRASAVLLAVACGLLSSVVTFVGDLLALRRLPVGVFGTLTSLNPVWAALGGWLVLQQTLRPTEWLGIALIVLSNVAVTACSRRGPSRSGADSGGPASVVRAR